MFKRGKVLVVDDDAEIGHAACLRLGAAGFGTTVALNGLEGLDRAIAELPQAIVLDVRMPGIDGLEVLARLKRQPVTRPIPVIVLSASMRDEQAALDCGARYFLRKPYNGEELLVAVEAAIREAAPEAVPARPANVLAVVGGRPH